MGKRRSASRDRAGRADQGRAHDLATELRAAAAAIDELTEATEEVVETQLRPVRENVLKRFPILFALLVTLGVTATLFGMEQVLMQFALLERYPWLILGLGLGILVLTGTLYKKLR